MKYSRRKKETTMKTKKEKTVVIRITESMYSKLEKLSQKRESNISAVAREGIAFFLSKVK